MLKKWLNRIGGGLVGFLEGLALGPFAFYGKTIANAHELYLIATRRNPSVSNKVIESCKMLFLISVLFAPSLAIGIFYGTIWGTQYGAKVGFANSFNGVAKELFTYEAVNINEYNCEVIPENKTLVSYKRMYSPKTMQDKEHLKVKHYFDILRQGQRDHNCILSKLPLDICWQIAAFNTKLSQEELKKTYQNYFSTNFRFTPFNRLKLTSYSNAKSTSDKEVSSEQITENTYLLKKV